MIAGRIDGGDTVDASWKTLWEICGQNTTVRSSVETLEESEDLGVQRFRRVERCHLLNSNMTVTLDHAIDQLLRSGVVSVGRIRESSKNHVADFDGDGEWGVGGEGIKVLRQVELGGRLPVTRQIDSRKGRTGTYHVVNGRDVTNGGGIARTCLDLLTIRKGLANTEADEVVPGGF